MASPTFVTLVLHCFPRTTPVLAFRHTRSFFCFSWLVSSGRGGFLVFDFLAGTVVKACVVWIFVFVFGGESELN